MQVNAPKQARSRDTLSKIVDATEVLMASAYSEEVSLRDILARSGVSVGSFYARFPRKEMLFREIYRQILVEFERTLLELEAAQKNKPVAGRVAALVRETERLYRRRAGIVRGMIVDFCRESFTPDTETRARFRRIQTIIHSILVGPRARRNAAAAEAVDFCIVTLTGAMRERFVFRSDLRFGAALTDARFTALLKATLLDRLRAAGIG